MNSFTTPLETVGCVVGIDASRNRSGGAKAHIIGILSAVEPSDFGIAEIHVWSYRELLDALPDHPWLVKHCPRELEGSIVRQLWWQRTRLPAELRTSGCEILLSTAAGTLCNFTPSVVMSRDMLSFEQGEIDRYWFSKAWIRLFLLRYIQISALRKASGALFLTQYASDVIQRFSGALPDSRVIPHGIGENFRTEVCVAKKSQEDVLNCVYVSNADLYKHQWHVIEAVGILRDSGHKLKLELVGAGAGYAREKVAEAIAKWDPTGEFVTITDAVPHHQVPAFLSAADIFIFASSCENMPNTLVEAMACSLPIACSSRGPMPEVLGAAGEYFDPEKPVTIAAAIAKLAADVTLRHERASEAKLLSAQYSWSRCASETWRYLVEIARARGRQIMR